MSGGYAGALADGCSPQHPCAWPQKAGWLGCLSRCAAPASQNQLYLHFKSQGFPDLLHIGNQSRPNIFDLEIRCPDTLYERVVEVRSEHAIRTSCTLYLVLLC